METEKEMTAIQKTQVYLENYREIERYIKDAISEVSQIDDVSRYNISAEKAFLKSIRECKAETVILFEHMKKALASLKEDAEAAGEGYKYDALEAVYIKGKSYEDIVRETGCGKNSPKKWCRSMTEYKYIIKYLEDLIKQNDLKPQLVCYDPHNASAFLSDLEALGFDSVAITQTAKELNDATVDFRLEIKAGNVVIEGTEVGKGKVVPFDELLTWSIANAKTISNSYGEIKIDKALDEDRIDPIDAIIDAWKAAMKEEYKPDTNEVVNEWLEMYEKYMGKGGEKE